MDAKKLLVGVATTAIGWMLGMWIANSVMGQGGMSAPVAAVESSDSEEGEEESE